MRRTIPLIASLVAALALLAAPAAASVTDTIVRDCQRSQTGYLTGTYTKAQLRTALNNLPSDVLEYSGCYDQIKQALRDAAAPPSSGGDGDLGGGGGTTGGGGTSAGGTTAGGDGGDPAAPATPHVGRKDPVELAGASVRPGAIPAIGTDAHALPTPLIVLLVLIGIGALAPATATLARRVIAHRRS